MNVTSWETEQNSQTPWKDGRRRGRARKRRRREVEGQKTLSDRGKESTIPSGDGNTENMRVKKWKQTEQSRRATCVCVLQLYDCICVCVLLLAVVGAFDLQSVSFMSQFD